MSKKNKKKLYIDISSLKKIKKNKILFSIILVLYVNYSLYWSG